MGFSNHASEDDICLSQGSLEPLELGPFWGSKLKTGIKEVFLDVFRVKIL